MVNTLKLVFLQDRQVYVGFKQKYVKPKNSYL